MTTAKALPPASRPCVSCPYRCDVPSGIWHPDEYAKLPAYDEATPFQPVGLFLCHQADGRVCAGWAGCHDGTQLLALRFAVVHGSLTPDEVGEVIDYTTPVALFASGAEAARHGMAEIDAPEPAAVAVMNRIVRKRARYGNESECGHDRAKRDDPECPECGADLAAMDEGPSS